MTHYDVILSGPWGAFGVSVASESEANQLSDVFANDKTEVEIIEIETQSFDEAAKSIADFIKVRVPLLKGQTK